MGSYLMLYKFRVDKWHYIKEKKYLAFDSSIVRIDNPKYYFRAFYFIKINKFNISIWL